MSQAQSVDLGIEGLTDAAQIGSGGFGVVYRAVQPAFRRTVAVKLLNASNLDDQAARRFERECQAMGAVSEHPGIVTVYDAGVSTRGQAYLVMAFLSGGSLADRLGQTGPLPWEETNRIGLQLADALSAAHDVRIVHRDVKPANVLISGYGSVQLGDFGIARMAGGHETKSASVTASLSYAPPEVLDGDSPTAAADIYALGATLYEILEGQPAFSVQADESVTSLIRRIATDPAPELTGQVPDGLAGLIRDSLAKQPYERPPSALAVSELLGEVARDEGIDTSRAPFRSAPNPAPADAPPPPSAGTPAADAAPSGPASSVPAPASFAFSPTHIIPDFGLPAWTYPDPDTPVAATLDPGLPVQLLSWWGEWAQIACSNSWQAWVNGRLLTNLY